MFIMTLYNFSCRCINKKKTCRNPLNECIMERKKLCLGKPSYLDRSLNTWKPFGTDNDFCTLYLLDSTSLSIMNVEETYQIRVICFEDFLHFKKQADQKFVFQTNSGFYGLQVFNEKDASDIESLFKNISSFLGIQKETMSSVMPPMNNQNTFMINSSNKSSFIDQEKKKLSEPLNLFDSIPSDNDTICDKMRTAIECGNVEEAKELVSKLAEKGLKLILHILEYSDINISVPVKIEGRDGKSITVTLLVNPNETIKMLKLKMFKDYHLPISCQQWIIQKRVAKDNELLCSYGILEPGTEAFLYLSPVEEDLNDNKMISNQNDKSIQTDDINNSFENNTNKGLQNDNVIGWECPKCTYRNIPTYPGCMICSNERPENYVIPENFVLQPNEAHRLMNECLAEQLTLESEEVRKNNEILQAKNNYQAMWNLMQLKLLRNENMFECPICFNDVEQGNGVVLRECLHEFCEACLAETINTNDSPEVACPYNDKYACPAIITHQEIIEILLPDDYDKYLQRSLRVAESSNSNSFHCRKPNCPGWCYYEDEVNFFDCPICESRNCLTCRAIHLDKTCKEYQDELKIKAQNDENAKKTQEMFDEMIKRGDAMLCPSCLVMVQKKSGCDWLRCTMCKTEICWATKGPRWGPKGTGDTSGGCKCRANGNVPCTPTCANCH
ncbi:ranBP-type and C3HC4-type zinc finger-containing protein 1-like isoform X2 [Hydra vulgaris]|uniref:RanBP-type and C3HC4-type zinc finger-containing protein 1 n=1 Tax=Hydra vulgaris TaxID=6087 RepID=A0ABM4DP26_HYDVU